MPETTNTQVPSEGGASPPSDAGALRAAAQDRFAQSVDWYATSTVHSQAASLERLVGLTAPRPGEWIADVATGAGHTAAALKRAQPAARVVATDLTGAMLVRARADFGSLGLPVLQADAESLPFRDGCLSAVVSRSAPHHFPDVAAFLREVARVLVHGGRLVISDPSCVEDPDVDAWLNAAELIHDPSHVKNYRLSEWKTMVDASPLTWVDGDDATRHTRLYSRWMQVVDDRSQVEDLRETFLQAPERVRTALTFRIDEGSPPEITYTVPQAIFIAHKA